MFSASTIAAVAALFTSVGSAAITPQGALPPTESHPTVPQGVLPPTESHPTVPQGALPPTESHPTVSRDAPPPTESRPISFNLTITSVSTGVKKYDSTRLDAAPIGAGFDLDALAVDSGFPPSSGFTANYTDQTSPSGNAFHLQFTQPSGSTPPNRVDSVGFSQKSSSNVQAAYVNSGIVQLFAFTESGTLVHYDSAEETDAFFYICPITQVDETEPTMQLCHVAEGEPDIDGCDQVSVQRAASLPPA